MTVTIRVDARDYIGRLNALEKTQLSFAISLAVNMTGLDFQKAERAHFAQVFTERRKDFLEKQGVKRIGPAATKRNPSVTFGVDPKADFLNKFELGTPKTPISGQHIAIPDNVKRNKADIITRSNRPRALVDRLGPRAFVLDQQKGKLAPGIYQRVGRGGNSVKRLYLLEPSVKTPAVLDFASTLEKTVHDRWAINFDAALKQAVATAK